MNPHDAEHLISDAAGPQFDPTPDRHKGGIICDHNQPQRALGRDPQGNLRCKGCNGDVELRWSFGPVFWGRYNPAHEPAEFQYDRCYGCQTPWPRPSLNEALCDECAQRKPDGYDDDTGAPLWIGADIGGAGE